jgi:hypothetical protein
MVPPRPATQDGTGQLVAGFSPDGRILLYLRGETDGQFRVVVAPVVGITMGVELAPAASFGADGPTINGDGFSPDGTAVLATYDAEKVAHAADRRLDADPLSLGELAFPAYQGLALSGSTNARDGGRQNRNEPGASIRR